MAQVVEHLPSKCEALSSTPVPPKKKKKPPMSKLKHNVIVLKVNKPLGSILRSGSSAL
jgi:hypothetical protein